MLSLGVLLTRAASVEAFIYIVGALGIAVIEAVEEGHPLEVLLEGNFLLYVFIYLCIYHSL